MKDIDKMTDDELRLEIAKVKGLNIRPNNVGFLLNWPADIAAAWELVEEMRADGKPVAVLAIPDKYTRLGVYEVKTYTDFGDQPIEFNYVHAPTAPLAICRAWLAWKQAQEVKK